MSTAFCFSPLKAFSRASAVVESSKVDDGKMVAISSSVVMIQKRRRDVGKMGDQIKRNQRQRAICRAFLIRYRGENKQKKTSKAKDWNNIKTNGWKWQLGPIGSQPVERIPKRSTYTHTWEPVAGGIDLAGQTYLSLELNLSLTGGRNATFWLEKGETTWKGMSNTDGTNTKKDSEDESHSNSQSRKALLIGRLETDWKSVLEISISEFHNKNISSNFWRKPRIKKLKKLKLQYNNFWVFLSYAMLLLLMKSS